jgi:hypothetical protein
LGLGKTTSGIEPGLREPLQLAAAFPVLENLGIVVHDPGINRVILWLSPASRVSRICYYDDSKEEKSSSSYAEVNQLPDQGWTIVTFSP